MSSVNKVYNSWNDVPKHWQNVMNNCSDFECGIRNKIFRLPQFCFRASCVAHDFSYRTGGGIKDWIRANNGFVFRMFEDIRDGNHPIVNRYFYYLMATLYFVFVYLFGWIFFNFGEKKTLGKILKEAGCL